MKKSKTKSDGGANKDHNVGDLKKLIAGCTQQMNGIDAERKELNERANDIREKLRNSGIQVAAFDFSRKLDKMETEARDDYLDSLRINMEAMGIGGQGTLFMNEASSEVAHEVKTPEAQTTH